MANFRLLENTSIKEMKTQKCIRTYDRNRTVRYQIVLNRTVSFFVFSIQSTNPAVEKGTLRFQAKPRTAPRHLIIKKRFSF